MTQQTKPCACGNPEHLVVRREGEIPRDFAVRKYATDECRSARKSAKARQKKHVEPVEHDVSGASAELLAALRAAYPHGVKYR